MKKSAGLLALLSSPKDEPESDDEMAAEAGGSAGDAAASELGELIGVKPRDQEAFKSLLKTFVVACKGE